YLVPMHPVLRAHLQDYLQREALEVLVFSLSISNDRWRLKKELDQQGRVLWRTFLRVECQPHSRSGCSMRVRAAIEMDYHTQAKGHYNFCKKY
ncbi:MAG: hypothetical protein ACKOBL_16830, partial [Chloroflexota bacterium]